jgi:hypothetical protein
VSARYRYVGATLYLLGERHDYLGGVLKISIDHAQELAAGDLPAANDRGR